MDQEMKTDALPDLPLIDEREKPCPDRPSAAGRRDREDHRDDPPDPGGDAGGRADHCDGHRDGQSERDTYPDGLGRFADPDPVRDVTVNALPAGSIP
jgi:hypothetical protein